MASENEKSFGDALRDAAGNIVEIVRAEFRLAKIEATDAAKAAAIPLSFVTLGALLAACALGFLLLTILFALALVLPKWLAALIVCVICVVAAAGFIAAGTQKLRRLNPLFAETTASVKEQLQWNRQLVK